MSNAARIMWIALIAVVASLATTGIASAQDGKPKLPEKCATCSDCANCDRAVWGTTDCDYEGEDPEDPDNGCCRLFGNACNPTFALSLEADDMEFVATEDGSEGVAVARLKGDVFGTWACEDGDLKVAYRARADGTFHSLSGDEFEAYRREYSLSQYVALLSDRLREAAQEAG